MEMNLQIRLDAIIENYTNGNKADAKRLIGYLKHVEFLHLIERWTGWYGVPRHSVIARLTILLED